MLTSISIGKFADDVIKSKSGYSRRELVQTLRGALEAKKNGAKCMICGMPIWRKAARSQV